jgi:uncharacterized protein (UPF0264 family)
VTPLHRPGLLASVRSLDEARIVLAAGVDVIDLKEPSAGALGAVSPEVARDVMDLVASPFGTPAAPAPQGEATIQRRPHPEEGTSRSEGPVSKGEVASRPLVSATIGDLPFTPENVVPAVKAMAATGVDIVKVGLFDGDAHRTLDALRPVAGGGVRLVAVMFADRAPDFALLASLRDAGFIGAMLDTADKKSGGLRDHLDGAALARFVGEARRRDLLCGLAGSLRLEDIAPLAALEPDYLGFRGALCRAGRDGALDSSRLDAVRQALRSTASSATATAGRQRVVASRTDAATPLPHSSVPAST